MVKLAAQTSSYFVAHVPSTLEQVPVDKIVVRRSARRYIDPDALEKLARSVERRGVSRPLILSRDHNNVLELLAGSRRLTAAKQVGLIDVPAHVYASLGAQDKAMLAALDYLQHEPLNRVDAVDMILPVLGAALGLDGEALVQRLGQLRRARLNVKLGKQPRLDEASDIEKVEEVFGDISACKWESFVGNWLEVLKWNDDVLEAVRSGELAFNKGRAINRVSNDDAREDLIETAKDGDVGVRDVQQQVRALTQREDEAHRCAQEAGIATHAQRWRALSPEKRAEARSYMDKALIILKGG